MMTSINPEAIKNIILEINGVARDIVITTESDLVNAGIFDSYSLIQFVVGLEDQLGIKFDFSDFSLDNFRTLNAICEMLRAKHPELCEILDR